MPDAYDHYQDILLYCPEEQQKHFERQIGCLIIATDQFKDKKPIWMSQEEYALSINRSS